MLEGRELEAAAVAARLKAFRADPARAVPRYLKGIEPLPDGAILLRFAQGKFPSRLPGGLAPAEAEMLRVAADEFVRRVCLWDHSDHYQVLCARRDAAYEAIKENYHLLMALLHPDRQEAASQAWPEAFAQRVNLAYATLGDDAARREYDARLRPHAAASAAPRMARRRAGDVRSAKTLLVVSAVMAALVAIGLVVEEDPWSDRSVLQAGLERFRANPGPAADRPRYVGATVLAPAQRASDAVEEPEPFALFKPFIRALIAEDPKPWVPPPKLDPIPAATIAVPVEPPPLKVAQALPAAPAVAPLPAKTLAPPARPTNLEIESLVVALIGYYEAGDAERLVGLLDPDATGYWRTAQMRQAYSDFFRATRVRQLRLERLAWKAHPGSARAKGEATIVAEYFGETAPVERRVDVEIDIVFRDGRARIAGLALFPGRR